MKKYLATATAMLLSVVMLIAVLLLALAGRITADSSTAKKTFVPWDSPTDEYVPVSSDSRYTLSVRTADQMFMITETESGRPLWYSAMTPETFSELDYSSDKWRSYMTSLLAVSYTSNKDTRGNFNSEYSASTDTVTKVFRGEDSVRFEFEFPVSASRVAMELSLRDNRLVVDIPAADIQENGDSVICSVEVLPYFGAVAKESNADGYLVYPDGSGAISYFDKADDKSAFAQPIKLDIYDTLNLEDTLSEKKNATASLPVYGIKNNDTAVMAAITKGSENACINVSSAIDNASVPIHRSSFEMYYRNEYRIYLSNIKGVTSVISKTFGTKLDPDLHRIDRQICYFLLQGEDADYSGMAVAYRDYLLKENILSEQYAPKETDLFLMLFMGIEKEGVLFNSYVPMTSYDDARLICNTLLENGVSSMEVVLRGWDKGGYMVYPQSGKTNSALGGKKDLAVLNAFAGSRGDLNVSLETELLLTDKNRYIAVKGTSLPIMDEIRNLFLLSPTMVKRQLNRMQNNTGRYDNLSLALSSIGSSVYPDYSKSRYATRTDTVKEWENILADERVAAVQGGNLYALFKASYLYDLPDTCSYQQITDRSIPWYFMIVSGVLPYATTAGNRTGDLTVMKLRWVEYGAMPYFELTESSVKELRDTGYNALFTSTYAKWENDVIAVYQEMHERMAPVVGKKMLKHTYVDEEQVLICYENGYRVLVNYSEMPLIYDGQTVGAQDYAVYSTAP